MFLASRNGWVVVKLGDYSVVWRFLLFVYPWGIILPRWKHNNDEDLPAAGELDPVNSIGTGIGSFFLGIGSVVGMQWFARAARIVHMGVRMRYVCWLVLAVCSAATAGIELPNISVYVEDSPVAKDLIDQASRLRHENRLSDAVGVYRQVLEQYPRKLTETENGLHTDMAGWVRRVVISDEDLLTSYRRVFNSEADRELEEITSPIFDEQGLERVLEMYWLCPAGLEAGLRLAGIYLERGDIALAGSVLEELEGHPDLSERKNLWHRLQAAVGVFGEDLDRYEKHLATLLSLGETDAAAEVNWWADQLERPVVAELFNSFSVLPAVMIPDPLGVPLWEKVLTKKDDQTVQAVTRKRGRVRIRGRVTVRTNKRAGVTYSPVVPVAKLDRLYVAGVGSVYALDRSSGRELWSFRGDTNADRTEAGEGRVIGRTLFGARGTVDQRAVLVSDGRVFSVLGVPVTARPGMRQDVEGTTLACLDRHDGHLLWRVRVGNLDPTLGTAQFYGTPVEGLDGVHVLVLRTERSGFRDAYVVTVDAITGRLKWRRHLFSVAVGRSRIQGLVGMTSERGRLYIADGFGDVACLDSRRGRMLWLSIASDQREDDRLVETPGGTAFDNLVARPVLVEAGLVVALRDQSGGGAVLLDPVSGRVVQWLDDEVWKDASYITDAPGGLLVVGPTIKLVDGKSLQSRWATDLSTAGIGRSVDPSPRGLAAVTQDRVLVPLSTQLVVLDLADGQPVGQYQVLETGNVLALPGQVVIAGSRSVNSYLSWEQAYDQLAQQIRNDPDDPEPGLALAHVSLAARKHNAVIEGVDRAIEALALRTLMVDKAGQAPGNGELAGQVQQNVFTQMLGLVDPEKAPSKELRRQIFDRLALVTAGPADEVAYHLAYGSFLVELGEAEQAVDHYQAVLQDRVLASQMYHHESGRRQAGLEAKSRLVKLVEDKGPRVYAKYESQAAQRLVELTSRPGAGDVAALIELSRRYSLSRSAPAAIYAAAQMLVQQGDRLAAIGQLRRAYRQTQEVALVQRIVGMMVSLYEETGQPRRALRWLQRVRRDHPSLMPLRDGRPVSFDQLATQLLGQPSANRGLPRVPQPLGTPFVLHERLLVPTAQKRELWPRDVVITVADGTLRMRGGPGLKVRWETAVEKEHLQLLALTENQALLWEPRNRVLRAFDANTGKPLWPALDVEAVFTAMKQRAGDVEAGEVRFEKPEADGVNQGDDGLFPNGGLFADDGSGEHAGDEPEPMLVTSNELYICVADATGRVVCIDRHSGEVAWRLAASFEDLVLVEMDDDVVVLAGRERQAESDQDEDGVLVLDAVTGEALFPMIMDDGEVQWAGLSGEGLLLYATDKQLVAYDLRSGQAEWGLDLGDMGISGRGWVSHDMALIEVRQFNGTLLMVNPMTGQRIDQISNLFQETARRLTVEKSDEGWCMFTPHGAVAFEAEGHRRWRSAVYQEAEDNILLGLVGEQSVVLVGGEQGVVLAKRDIPKQDILTFKHTLYLLDRTSGILVEQQKLEVSGEPIDPDRAVLLDGLVVLSTASTTMAIPKSP